MRSGVAHTQLPIVFDFRPHQYAELLHDFELQNQLPYWHSPRRHRHRPPSHPVRQGSVSLN